jgi:hypothetical protein
MNRLSKLGLLTGLILVGSAQGAMALDADYWRGGWRTELGTEPHIYQFIIEGEKVSGFYCTSCSDATTIGFIDGTFSEADGINYTVRFPEPDGTIHTTLTQQASLAGGQLSVSGDGFADGLTLIKDPRGPEPGGSAIEMYPPGTPPTEIIEPGPSVAGNISASAQGYWYPGDFKEVLTVDDVAGTWIALFWGGIGMNKQYFHIMPFEDELRGVVCGRCDNPYTMGGLTDITLVDGTLYFKIDHQDWGPPVSAHQDAGRIVQNEMVVVAFLGEDIDADNPPAGGPPPLQGYIYSMLGPIPPEATRGNSSENVDIWGPGTGDSIEPPENRKPIQFNFPE